MDSLTKAIQKESISAARLILKSCRTLQPQLPRGKLSFTVNSETYIHLITKSDASQELGLLGKTKAQLDKKTKVLEKNLCKTLNWITTGKKLFEEDFNHPAEFIPNAYFLLYLELEAVPRVPSKEIYSSYFVLALYLVARYESSRHLAYGDPQDFENPEKALQLTEKSASSLEFLLLAQTALELGLASKRASKLGLDRRNEERDFAAIFDLAQRAKSSQDQLQRATHSRSKNAIDKWAPFFLEVKALIGEGRGVTNACVIVANRHPEVDMKQLKRAYYHHQKKT